MSNNTYQNFRIACTSLTLVLLTFISTASAQQNLQLVFGLYTTDKPTVLVKAFRPILTAIETDLSQSLGVTVNIRTHISPSYDSGVAALVNGDVDFARFGPASYISATEQNPQLRILALDSKDDAQSTKGVISVHEDSSFQKISDLNGARFAFGNEESTIGRYLSQAYLLMHGISTRELAHYEYLGRHDRVGHAVANGSFDAGALKEGTFNKLRKKGLPLRALVRFDNVNKPWIASSNMNEKHFNALRNVMFNLSNPDAFESMGRKQFVIGSDSDFQTIRDAMINNDKFFQDIDSIDTADIDAK